MGTRHPGWLDCLPDNVSRQHHEDLEALDEQREDHLKAQNFTLNALSIFTQPSKAQDDRVAELKADLRDLEEGLRDLAVKRAAYAQMPIPGLHDFTILPEIFKVFDFNDFGSGFAKDLNKAFIWVSPVMWIELAALPGFVSSTNNALTYETAKNTYLIYQACGMEHDRVEWHSIYGNATMAWFLPPVFISSITGGPELYSKLRSAGTPWLKAVRAVMDTLTSPDPDWVEAWFDKAAAKPWQEHSTHMREISQNHLNSIQLAEADMEALDGFDMKEAWRAQNKYTTSMLAGLECCLIWSRVQAAPRSASFDVEAALGKLCEIGQEGSVRGVGAGPFVAAHLFRHCSLNDEGKLVLPGLLSDVHVYLNSLPERDEVILVRSVGPARAYLPPIGLASDAAAAYVRFREQGLSPKDAESMAVYAVSEPAK